MEFKVLGGLMIRANGRPVPLGVPKQRTLTAILLVKTNAVVPLHEIAEELWGDAPPKSATANIRTYAARLRAALPPAERGRLVVRPLGLLLVAVALVGLTGHAFGAATADPAGVLLSGAIGGAAAGFCLTRWDDFAALLGT